MSKSENLLIEIFTEELPPKAIAKLVEAFAKEIANHLQKLQLNFADYEIFATPRRLAVRIANLDAKQADQKILKRGPALAQAYLSDNSPSPACQGFAKSCGVTVEELIIIKNNQGEWVGYEQHQVGKSLEQLLPAIIEQSLLALPIAKRMRWGDKDIAFIRPIHAISVLYGARVITGQVLNFSIDRITYGHRFHAPQAITLEHANSYETQLEQAYVIPSLEKRRQRIIDSASALCEKLTPAAEAVWNQELLSEVTGLVEWPHALLGSYEATFLTIPEEMLVTSMQAHQRYFAVQSQGKLLPNFITISNIDSENPAQVVRGNERVLKARLADAAFFYNQDKVIALTDRLAQLKLIRYQEKLGSIADKVERIKKLSSKIAEQLPSKVKVNSTLLNQAAEFAKADLTSQSVGEFPELQGVMGYYFALHQGYTKEIAEAIKDHYAPRFAGDDLPANIYGQIVALADKLDTLVAIFSIGMKPTGDKDPYGLRRAALGILRIIIEKQFDLDLLPLIEAAFEQIPYAKKDPHNFGYDGLIHTFLKERLKSLVLEAKIGLDTFNAVCDRNETRELTYLDQTSLHFNPYDLWLRIQAVEDFKKLPQAQALAGANKRVSNLLQKVDAIDLNYTYKANMPAETALETAYLKAFKAIQNNTKNYQHILHNLAELQLPIDNFFNDVMVMSENINERNARLMLLKKIRAEFLRVADIALLQ